jgi:hypothetical protein
LALHVRGGLRAHLLRCGSALPLVGSPAVRVKLREAQRGQQRLTLQQAGVRAPSAPLRPDRARGMRQGGPPPARGRLTLPGTPHGGQRCGAAPTALPGRRAADLPLPRRGSGTGACLVGAGPGARWRSRDREDRARPGEASGHAITLGGVDGRDSRGEEPIHTCETSSFCCAHSLRKPQLQLAVN